MEWIKTYTAMRDEEAWLDLPLAAKGLWHDCRMWSGAHETDGRIPRTFVRRIAGEEEGTALAALLVHAELWTPTDDGWLDVRFTAEERCAEEIEYQRMSGRRRAELHRGGDVAASVKARDGDKCRHCGCEVNWRDRRGPTGGTYDHVDPHGPTTAENVVVACRACTSRKGQQVSSSGSRSDLGSNRAEVEVEVEVEVEPETGPAPASAREEPFGHDPDAAAIAPVHTRWMEACAKATPPISEYIAGSTFGSVLAGYTAAVKGGEPREDVLAAMDELALSLARKPRAVPSRLDIALRVMRARKAEQMTASPSDQHRVAQQRQDEREAERREVWDRAEHIAFSLQNGESIAVPPELVDEVRSCLAGWVGWEQVDAVLAGKAA